MPFTALIIDADGKTPATLKSILAPHGFEFTVTENGPEAVNVARQAAPDIILLRAELPLTTGFSVCNRLRRNEDTRKIPLVLYSSNASDDVIDQHRNLKTHADDYLKLPLEPERLLTAIRAHLKLPNRPVEPARAASKPEPKAKPRLEVELTEVTSKSTPAAENQFDKEFGAQFDNLAEAGGDDDDRTHAIRQPNKSGRPVEPSGARRVSGPEPAAGDSESSDGGGFKAQREALQLKAQLNAKNREILALKDDLEARERAILDGKKHSRDLQAQLGEYEAQLLAAQEQILSSRETVEAAQRDKQTILKREEGLKGRVEQLQKRQKELETELAQARQAGAQELAQARKAAEEAASQAASAATDAGDRLRVQSGVIRDLEAERDELTGRVAAAEQQIAALQEELVAARDEAAGLAASLQQSLQDGAQSLADARAAAEAQLAAQAERHQNELATRAQEQQAAIDELRGQVETGAQEQARLAPILLETEENARLQIAQLTQTLSATEESARTEILRLTHNLAAAEETARGEVQRLQQAAADAAEAHAAELAEQTRRITAVESDIDELGVSLDRAETALHRRKEAALHAQQALAVALRLLEDSEAT